MDTTKDCVAIDGPGGVGKSTLARAVAKHYGITYLDTGAMYRALGVKCMRLGVDVKDAGAVERVLRETKLDFAYQGDEQHILLDGEDVEAAIRAPAASRAAADVSTHAEVRRVLGEMQRAFAAGRSVVMDGRDIGTHVLPDAKYKIFLTASSYIRARRRFEELRARGSESTFEQVLGEMIARDEQDSTRSVAPLRPATDAVILNTDALDAQGVYDKVLDLLEEHA